MILRSAQQNINKFYIKINQLKQYTKLENSKEQFAKTQWYSIEFSALTQNNSVTINSLPEPINNISNLLKIGNQFNQLPVKTPETEAQAISW